MHRRFASEAEGGSPGSLLRHFVLVASLAALSLTASASPAAGSVTIGQLPPGTPADTPCGLQFDLVQETVTSGNTYVVPPTVAAGTVASWSHNALVGDGQMLTMKIFRKVADPATYMVVGHDGPRALTGGTVNTFPANIPVKAGDVLGVNSENSLAVDNACAFTVPGNPILYREMSLADGESGEFLTDSEFRVNATAVVAPTNDFTLGKATRNKKKGTATLTVNVPNPGELTGSGKGVKVASAAVTSKTISAPGAVKLKIRAKGKKKKKLNLTDKVKLKPKITYTPTGGDPNTQSIKVKLKRV